MSVKYFFVKIFSHCLTLILCRNLERKKEGGREELYPFLVGKDFAANY